ncbi:ACP S-malonyltransferase [Chromobacterium violaceum]|uniref:ACP S-malonyltransferase n=1 Tax=Chromobacterium violaceum TaxID=536 RepID=UPI0005D451CB|nr:ACP S-malonyltransferase [Chromobacterium violaceum]
MPYLHQGKQCSIVFMLPGQGGQFYQMGRELYQNQPAFHRWMNELDSLVRTELGRSVIAEIYDDNHARSKAFDDIRLSHPAIFMVEYALGKTIEEQGIKPDHLLGASLGELVAAALSNMLSLPDAIRLVVAQGKLFHDRHIGAEGAMLAILAGEPLYRQTPLLNQHCEIAAHNADSLIVVAGSAERIADAERHLRDRDIVVQRLPVRQAFHSRQIDFLRPEVEALTSRLNLGQAQIPLISCSEAGPLAEMRTEYFWQVIRQPIRFSQTLARLEREAAERGETPIYLDLGPSGTLANLVRQNIGSGETSRILSALSPFGRDLEKFDEVLALARKLQTWPSAAKTEVAIDRPLALSSTPERQIAPEPTGPKHVCLFPGQGSQRIGMGEGLFDRFPEQLAQADAILGYSLKTLCLEDPEQQLSNTRYTQPALYTVGALSFLDRQRRGVRPPDFVAGHSLGEYCALFAAGAFPFEIGLKLVKKRGELMAKASGGGMAAVIGRAPDEIRSLLSRHGLDALDVANYNSHIQTVLAGPIEVLSDAREIFLQQNITFVPLPVSAPFHSRYMQDAMREFGDYLRQFSYSPLRIPVISNVHAAPYRDDQLIDNLTRQICGSVRWLDTVRYLMGQGEFEYEELGPGNVLSKLVDSIRNA